jgi:hypothetical protein
MSPNTVDVVANGAVLAGKAATADKGRGKSTRNRTSCKTYKRCMLTPQAPFRRNDSTQEAGIL